MIGLVVFDPVSREEIDQFAREEGFSWSYDDISLGLRSTNWRRDGVRLGFDADALSGAVLLLEEEDTALTARLRARFRCHTLQEALDYARAAEAPVERVRTLRRLGGLLSRVQPREDAVALIRERLLDAAKPVRWAALSVAQGCFWTELDAPLAEAAERYEDMQPALAQWSEARRWQRETQQKEEQRLLTQERRERLKALAASAEWSQLLETAEALLEEKGDSAEAWHSCALAYAGLSQPGDALAAAATAVALAADSERASYLESLRRIAGDIAPDDEDAADDLFASLLEVYERLEASDAEYMSSFPRLLRALREASPVARKELTFALGVALSLDADKEAAEILEEAAAGLPEMPEAWYALGRERLDEESWEKAEAALTKALVRLRANAPRAPEATRVLPLYEKLKEPLRQNAILSDLAEAYRNSKQYEKLLSVAMESLARDSKDVSAWQDRAIALTFLKRHEEAIAAYGDALSVMEEAFTAQKPQPKDDPRGLMHFNRTCEWARLGKKEEALRDLRAAIKYQPDWGAKAKQDDYFEKLWDDRDFLLAASGRTLEEITPEEVHRLSQQCMGYFYKGMAEEALAAGEEAVEAAEILGDKGLLSDALKTYGNALTYLESPREGIAWLERAVSLAEAAWPDNPGKRAEARHLLGAAYHAAGELRAAERLYRKALEERTLALGESSWQLARSYGDIARLEADQGRPVNEVVKTIEEGRSRIRRFLKQSPPPEERMEALFDLATLSSNLGRIWLDNGKLSESLSALEEAASLLSDMVDAGHQPSPSLVRNAIQHASTLAERAESDAQREKADQLSMRLFAILEPSPVVREERLYWARLKAGVRALKAKGVKESDLARAMREALRGNEAPEPLRSHPAFANLPLQLATRLGRRGDLVLVAMSIDTAIATGNLEEALTQLEELAVAEILSLA